MLPSWMSPGKYHAQGEDLLLTSNYLELREMLLARCDPDKLTHDRARFRFSPEYAKIQRLSDDKVQYAMDRPLFDQFISGKQTICEELRDRCLQANYDPETADENERDASRDHRRVCDRFHPCPQPEEAWLQGWCLCSKTGLTYIWYVVNRHTNRRAWVGSSCIKHFDRAIQEAYTKYVKTDKARARVIRPQLINMIRDDDDLPNHLRGAFIDVLEVDDDGAFCRRYDEISRIMDLPEDLADFIVPDGDSGSSDAEDETSFYRPFDSDDDDDKLIAYAEHLEEMYDGPSSSDQLSGIGDNDGCGGCGGCDGCDGCDACGGGDSDEGLSSPQHKRQRFSPITSPEDVFCMLSLAYDMLYDVSVDIKQREAAREQIKALNVIFPDIVRDYFCGGDI